MKNQFYPPRIPYIVFELVKINVEDYLTGNYLAQVEETIYLAVTPEQFSYRVMARDAIMQTDNKVFVNKFGLAPERCTISGTFGVQHRLIAGTYMSGWDRLKQFEDQIIKKAKKTELPDTDTERFLYAVNYYDFLNQKFGSINVQSFAVSGNARENTMLPRYSCDFIIVGELEHTKGTDKLLSGLQAIFGKEGVMEKALVGPENIMDFVAPALESIQGLDQASKMLRQSVEFAKDAGQFINEILDNTKGVYTNVKSLFLVTPD